MSNLTFDHHLLKEHKAEPLEGHAVVVFERIGEQGDEFHSVLLPGAAPLKKGLPIPFRKQPEYFAYAADTAPERHLDFSESMRLADHVSEFRVVFNLAYAVADPRALARRRNTDPLRKVRDQVRVTIKREVERLPWQAVWEAFPQHERDVVDDCMDEMRAFAATYGIAIHALRLSVRLPEAMESIHQEERLAIVQRESEQRRTNHDRILNLQNVELEQTARMVDGDGRLAASLMDSTIAAVERGDLGTADDLIKRVRTLYPGSVAAPGEGTGVGGWTPPGGGAGTRPPALPPGGFQTRELPPSPPTSAPGQGLHALLADVVAATSVVKVRSQRQALRSALLHLAAELLVDDQADSAGILRCAERARTAVGRLDPSPGGAELDALKALADPEHLLGRLD